MTAVPEPIDLLAPAGLALLRETIAGRALLAFDFDGTLAEIVEEPDRARLDDRARVLLARLVLRHPVAIVSGRGLEDLRWRIGLPEVALVGGHGSEWPIDASPAFTPGSGEHGSAEQADAVAAWGRQLPAALATLGPGIRLETKRLSLTVHFRASADPVFAEARIAAIASTLKPRPDLIGGKFVWNLMPPGAGTKYEAMALLRERTGAVPVLFVGDDTTDEIVFARAPADWLTVRVLDALPGEGDPGVTRARAFVRRVDGVVALLEQLLHL